MSDLYTPDTLAERWGCSKYQVVKLARSGRLSAFSIGSSSRGLRIKAEAVERYVTLYGQPRPQRARDLSLVYFIRAGEFVKVGKTFDVEARLADLQIGNPHTLELLATEPGHVDREAALHRQFGHLRHRGEWFRYEGDIVGYIAGLAG